MKLELYLFYLQVDAKARLCICLASLDREHMLCIPLLSSHQNFISLASHWTHLWVQHQISCVAWPHCHAFLHCSWDLLCCSLGCHGWSLAGILLTSNLITCENSSMLYILYLLIIAWQLLKWDFHEISNVAGEIALICGLLMWVTTFPTIRRKMFELFFYTHQLYFLFLLFYLLHLGIRVFTLILPGVYLFLLDRYLRFLQSRRKARLVSARLLHSETLELNFSKHLGTLIKLKKPQLLSQL